MPGEAGGYIAQAVLAQVDPKQRWLDPPSKALTLDLGGLTLLRERYPEFVTSEDELLRSVVEYDFVASIALGIRKHRALGRWTMYESAAHEFARQLHGDVRLRGTLTEAVGLDLLEEFDAQAPAALRAAIGLGDRPGLGAVRILETGSARE